MTQIKLRRDTSANFTSANPILGQGEPAYETDTKKLKIGDGTTAYTQLEYFSAGGGSTDITATLDELGNEVNGLSGRVTAAEADIMKKEDKLTPVAPLYKTEKSQSTLKGFSFTPDNTGIYSTTGWGTCVTTYNDKNMSFAESGGGGDISSPWTKDSLKAYLTVPFNIGQVVKYPNRNAFQSTLVCLGYFNAEDAFIPVARIISGYVCRLIEGDKPTFRTRFQVSFPEKSVYGSNSTRWTPINSGHNSFFQLFENEDGTIGCSGVVADKDGSYDRNYCYYVPTVFSNQSDIERIKKITAMIIVPCYEQFNSSSYRWGLTSSDPIQLDRIGVYNVNGIMGKDFTDMATIGTSVFGLDVPIKANYIGLSLGDGLVVKDNKLTNTAIALLDAKASKSDLAVKQDKLNTIAPLGINQTTISNVTDGTFLTDTSAVLNSEFYINYTTDENARVLIHASGASGVGATPTSFIQIPFTLGDLVSFPDEGSGDSRIGLVFGYWKEGLFYPTMLYKTYTTYGSGSSSYAPFAFVSEAGKSSLERIATYYGSSNAISKSTLTYNQSIPLNATNYIQVTKNAGVPTVNMWFTTNGASYPNSGYTQRMYTSDTTVLENFNKTNVCLLLSYNKSRAINLTKVTRREVGDTVLSPTVNALTTALSTYSNSFDATAKVVTNDLSLAIGSGLAITDGKLTASSTAPANMVTTDNFVTFCQNNADAIKAALGIQ